MQRCRGCVSTRQQHRQANADSHTTRQHQEAIQSFGADRGRQRTGSSRQERSRQTVIEADQQFWQKVGKHGQQKSPCRRARMVRDASMPAPSITTGHTAILAMITDLAREQMIDVLSVIPSLARVFRRQPLQNFGMMFGGAPLARYHRRPIF